MELKEAQNLVKDHLEKVGYTKIETTPTHAFLHLIEETGEVADIFWQTLKLASYLDIDLESAFLQKYEKNKAKGNNKV